jgi:aminopeptidase YwaD
MVSTNSRQYKIHICYSAKYTLLFLFFHLTFLFSAQEVKKGKAYDYSRRIVDTMASENMHGRGYVNDGDKIAANYIRNEFKKFGLKSFTEDYYQRFNFPINTFSGKIYFYFEIINGRNTKKRYNFKGVPGKNFLVDPASANVNTHFSIVVFDSTNAKSDKAYKKFLKNVLKEQFILVDDRGVIDKTQLEYFKKVKSNEIKVAGIIELVKKLTWDQSQTISNYVRIQILADSFRYSRNKRIESIGRIDIESKLIPDYISQNVTAYVQGSVYPDSFVVFSAHYDHLGQMGKDTYFPGANDNASGSAMLLNLARYYSLPENKPKCSIAFISFGAEEVGLLGSKYYVEHPQIPLKQIRFLVNMDIMGTGEDGITVVNGSLYKEEYEKLKQINTENDLIKDVKSRGKAANSDHYFFSEIGVKSYFIYTLGGIKAYHDIYDRPETLPLNEFEDLFKLIIKFADYLNNK